MKRYNPYANTIIDGQMCVWLQDHGWQPAKLAEDLRPGDFIVYNYGHVSKITAIKGETASFVHLEIVYPDCWGNWEKSKVDECKKKKGFYVPVTDRRYVEITTKHPELI